MAMLGGLALCGATATIYYHWGHEIKGKVEHFNSITRVIDFKWLDDLVKEKTTNLLVLVSGRVVSATPFICKFNGPLGLGVVFEDKAEVNHEIKLQDDGVINKSISVLLQRKEAPWYLEDSLGGRVKVVDARHAVRFDKTVQPFVVKPLRLGEFFNSLISPEKGSKVICGHALNVGTSLTFVGEAVRDKAGNLMIQKSEEQRLMVFSEEGSFDKMVANMKSDSEFYIFYSKIFGTIAVAIVVMYGVDFVRKVVLPYVRKKRAENAESDSEDDL